jgi:hypothetical protein
VTGWAINCIMSLITRDIAPVCVFLKLIDLLGILHPALRVGGVLDQACSYSKPAGPSSTAGRPRPSSSPGCPRASPVNPSKKSPSGGLPIGIA